MIKEIKRVREAELYKNAAIFFNRNGYSSTSIRQIGRAIGIREGSIYHYIRSKQDLLFNICEWAMRTSLDAIAPLAKQDLNPGVKLKQMIKLHIATLAKNSTEHCTMLKELRSLDRNNKKKIIKLRDRYEAFFRDVIEDCVRNNIFRDLDIKMTTIVLLGMMNSLVRWYSSEGPIKSETISDLISNLFFDGVKS